MKKYILDTNCLISYVTDRDETQRSLIIPYFESAAQSQCTLIVLVSVIIEFVTVLLRVYRTDPKIVHEMVLTILHSPGMSIDQGIDLDAAMLFWPNQIKDFGDALIASYAHRNQLPVLTLDRAFIKELQDSDIGTEIIH